jgi:predicted Zn-dependent protease
MLQTHDHALVREIRERLPRRSWLREPHLRVLQSGWLGIAGVGLTAVLVILLAYFVALPAVGEQLALQIARPDEMQMGDSMMEGFHKQLVIDTARSKQLQAFADELKLPGDYPLKVYVAKSYQINAFALPGGHVVVFSALLDSLKQADELVALLGHEYGHVQRRHSLRILGRAMSTLIVGGLVFGDVGGVSSTMIEGGDFLRRMHYSRELETEADEFSLQMLEANGLSPQAPIRLFAHFRKLELSDSTEHATEADGVGKLATTLLSSHPLTDDRIAHFHELVKGKADQPQRPTPGLDKAWLALRPDLAQPQTRE